MTEDVDNMEIYRQCAEVPLTATRTITAGRLKGRTDINPMWRIKKLTELFGPCGIGWKTQDVRYSTIKNDATGEVAVFCELYLLYRHKKTGEWSEPVFGVGGNSIVALENDYDKNGNKIGKKLYLNDEAYKMAYTDAISVACKALGMGANVYWNADNTKYSQSHQSNESEFQCTACGQKLKGYTLTNGQDVTPLQQAQGTQKTYGRCLCFDCSMKQKAGAAS